MSNNLKSILGEFSLSEFITNYWEKSPLLVRSKDRLSDNNWLNLEQFDELVFCSNLRHPFFRVFKNGQLISPAKVTTVRQVGLRLDTGLANLDNLYDIYNNGGTIVLVSLEKYFEPVAQYCRQLEDFFRFPVQAYAYLTPVNVKGVSPHYDTHEVFVLQLEGKKNWKVWSNPVKLPMRVSQNNYDYENIVKYSENNKPLLETTLEPGDLLYIPRGFIHNANTDDYYSLHISISIMITRWVDILESIILEQLSHFAEESYLCKSLPFGRSLGELTDAETKEDIHKMLLWYFQYEKA